MSPRKLVPRTRNWERGDATQLLCSLTRAATVVSVVAERELRTNASLSLAGFVSLRLLREHPLSVGELSRRLGMTSSGTSKLVRRLSAAGLVARGPARADARVSTIVATANGKRVVGRAHRQLDARLEAVLSAEITTAVPELSATLTALADHLSISPNSPN